MSLVRFSYIDDVRELPMGKLNIKQRLSSKVTEETEDPIKFEVLENKTIQTDRWNSVYDDTNLYGLIVEVMTVYRHTLEDCFEYYVENESLDPSLFDHFENSYNEYLDYIEESVYLCFENFNSDSDLEIESCKVPFVERDDVSSINSNDSCQCVDCKKSR